jgi:hypothetical protein
VAVPSVVPPLVHDVGSEPGPNTVKVIGAVALVPEDPTMVDETAEPSMAVPAMPVAGPSAVTVGLAAATTTVASGDVPTPLPFTVAVAEMDQVPAVSSA